jgi:hypothetical protein
MMIKNPYRITEKMDCQEAVPTANGNLPAYDWCKREAARLILSGVKARAVKCRGKCYVVRPMEGCLVGKGDKPEKKKGGR